MRLAIALLVATSAFAQTAVFPGSVVTDGQVMVGKNNVATTLTASMMASDTVFAVVNPAGFVANSLATINSEIVVVCGVAGNLIQVGKSSCPNVDGRGFDGSTAAAHTGGTAVSLFIDAWHHNSVTAEVKAIETALGANLANIPGSPSGGTVPISKGGTGQTTASAARTALSAAGSGTNSDITSLTGLSTPIPIAEGGTNAITAGAARTSLGAAGLTDNNALSGNETHSGTEGFSNTATFTGPFAADGATLTRPNRSGTGSPNARDNCATVGETYFQTNATAGQNIWLCTTTGTPGTWTQVSTGSTLPSATGRLQYLRTKATSTSSYEFAALNTFYTADYVWATQSPAGSLTGGGGVQSVTLTPCPLGITDGNGNWSPVYVAGVGTPEALTPSGGTCTSGGATGSINISPLNNHGGGYTVQPATAGVQECILANSTTSNSIRCMLPGGTFASAPTLIYAGITIPAGQIVSLRGLGIDGSFLSTSGATTGNWLTWTAGSNHYCDLGDFAIGDSTGTFHTSGAIVTLNQCWYGAVTNLAVYYGYDALDLVYPTGNLQMVNVQLFAKHDALDVSGTQAQAYLVNSTLSGGACGFCVEPGTTTTGLYLANNQIATVINSTVTSQAIFLNSNNSAPINEVIFTGNDLESTGPCFEFQNDGTAYHNNHVIITGGFMNCQGGQAVYLLGKVQDVMLSDMHITHTGANAANTVLMSDAQNVQIQGVRFIVDNHPTSCIAAAGTTNQNWTIQGNSCGRDASTGVSPTLTNGVSLFNINGAQIINNDLVATNPLADNGGNTNIHAHGNGSALPFADARTCAAGMVGWMQDISDSNTVTWGANIAGSSTNKVVGWCNGSNWTVVGK